MVCGSCVSHGRECYDCYKWCVGHVRVMEGSVMIVTNGVWVMCESWKGVL